MGRLNSSSRPNCNIILSHFNTISLLNSLLVGDSDLARNSRNLLLDSPCRLFTPLPRFVRVTSCIHSRMMIQLALSRLHDAILVGLLRDSFDGALRSYTTLSITIWVLDFAQLVWYNLKVNLLFEQCGWHSGLGPDRSRFLITRRISLHNLLFTAVNPLRSRRLSNVFRGTLFGVVTAVTRGYKLIFLTPWLWQPLRSWLLAFHSI